MTSLKDIADIASSTATKLLYLALENMTDAEYDLIPTISFSKEVFEYIDQTSFAYDNSFGTVYWTGGQLFKMVKK